MTAPRTDVDIAAAVELARDVEASDAFEPRGVRMRLARAILALADERATVEQERDDALAVARDGWTETRKVVEAVVEQRTTLSDDDKTLLRWGLSHAAANSVDDAEVERLRALLVRLGAVD